MSDVVMFFVGFAIMWCVFFYFFARSAPLPPRRGQKSWGCKVDETAEAGFSTPTQHSTTSLANDPVAQRATRPDTPRWRIPNSPDFVESPNSPDVRPFSTRCRIGTGGQGLTVHDLAKESSRAASKSATL